MTGKPLKRSTAARIDERQAVAYYAREAGLDGALRLTDALRAVYRTISERPRLGSPRYGDLLRIEGLRSTKAGRFPYVVLYVEKAGRIEVWRVLHAQRDIPAELSKEEG